MRNWLSTAAAASTLALLVGCSGQGSTPASSPGNVDDVPGPPKQFITLTENWGYAFRAQPLIEQARATRPTSEAFSQGLYEGYMEHAEYEYGPLMMDYKDAIYHTRRATASAGGNYPQPTILSERVLPADKVDELTQGRGRLIAALDAGGRQNKGVEAGKAQAYYDCWVEQQEENFQPQDIEYCRNGFYANLDAIEVKPAQVPEVTTLSSDVLFDFDRSTLRDQFRPELDRLAEILVRDTSTNVLVWGHTDTAGPVPYNQRLSERRAETVARYMESRGVSRSRMQIQGYGETRLAVPTPDNTPEQRNRRVEVRRR